MMEEKLVDIKPIKLMSANTGAETKHNHHYHHLKREPGLDMSSHLMTKDMFSTNPILNPYASDSLTSQLATATDHGFTVDSLMNAGYPARIHHGTYPYHINDDNLQLQARFHPSNYHHHGGWNPPDTPPETVPTTLHSNNNNTSGSIGVVSIGATNVSNSLLSATNNSAIGYRDGPFFEQNCHMDAGSPNGSLASASPPSVIGSNHVSNYRSHMNYSYPV